MDKPNLENWQSEIEKKHNQDLKRKKKKMKVSGASVKVLQRIIKKNA